MLQFELQNEKHLLLALRLRITERKTRALCTIVHVAGPFVSRPGRWYRAAFNLSTFSSKCPTVKVFQFRRERSKLAERAAANFDAPALFNVYASPGA